MTTMSTISSAPSPMLRFLVRNFVKYNPCFVVSAMLLLGGALLLNPPQADGGRSLPLLFKLLGLIQLYEFMLLGAGALLARRAELERDVRFLMVILSPFLLDVTFTTSSLVVSLLNQVRIELFKNARVLSLPASGHKVFVIPSPVEWQREAETEAYLQESSGRE